MQASLQALRRRQRAARRWPSFSACTCRSPTISRKRESLRYPAAVADPCIAGRRLDAGRTLADGRRAPAARVDPPGGERVITRDLWRRSAERLEPVRDDQRDRMASWGSHSEVNRARLSLAVLRIEVRG